MPIFNDKLDILNEISALKSLTDGFPELDLGNSFPSLNNRSNTVDFLLDLIKTLIGYEQLRSELIRFLTYQTNGIEASIKLVLKNILKKTFSCSTDAVIPPRYINTLGSGFNISLDQIDFFEILKVNPNSVEGGLIYGDVEKDLNSFLYQTLQGNTGVWKSLIRVEYLQSGVVDGTLKTNVLNIKIDESWQGRTVNDFINQFLDSIVLFTLPNLVNKIFDVIFGTISSFLGKPKDTIESEVQLEILVNKIIDLPDTEIDNSYFEFTGEEIDIFNEKVDEKTSGRKILKDCNFVSSFIDFSDLVDTNDELSNTSNFVEIKTVLENRFNVLADKANSGLDSGSQTYGKNLFFENLLRGILQALANVILAPKAMLMLLSYFKIVNGTIGFFGFSDFLGKNRQFLVQILRDSIIPLVTEFLLRVVIKHLTRLIVQDQAGRALEMIKNQQLQILSLLGVPSEIRDLIARL